MAAGRLLAEQPEAIVPPVRAILEAATRLDARAVFDARAKLRALRRRADAVLAGVDFLLLPTTPTIYRIDEIEADPRRLNATLATYTNFVNLLDLAALAVPAGFRPPYPRRGCPSGVTLIGPCGQRRRLGARFGSALHRATSTTLGATGAPLPAAPAAAPLVSRARSRSPSSARTSPASRSTTSSPTSAGASCAPPRPRPPTSCTRCRTRRRPSPGWRASTTAARRSTVEVWALSPAAFGTFVARIPPPLCIGSLALADGSRVSGFLCEPHALAGAADITPSAAGAHTCSTSGGVRD